MEASTLFSKTYGAYDIQDMWLTREWFLGGYICKVLEESERASERERERESMRGDLEGLTARMAGAGGDNLRNAQLPLQPPAPEIEHFAVPVGANTEQRLAALETRVGQMAERMGRLEHDISLRYQFVIALFGIP
ncbi:hypothetical protein O6H91_05G104700 [Diphasiastrum complanatum]|uniref:Uncharacterized protein n=1 Tax=Diphasiastrum complanatum TaxID=34168 RepID=A0ACC2DRY3_DIPCM|nr:hypothetical protein O6H91_05G104700 [Diphasiastrum complanatum]